MKPKFVIGALVAIVLILGGLVIGLLLGRSAPKAKPIANPRAQAQARDIASISANGNLTFEGFTKPDAGDDKTDVWVSLFTSDQKRVYLFYHHTHQDYEKIKAYRDQSKFTRGQNFQILYIEEPQDSSPPPSAQYMNYLTLP